MNYTIFKKNKFVSAVICSNVLISLVGCNDNAGVQTLPKRTYQLVWSDEFNNTTTSVVDNTKWNIDSGIGSNNDGWGNDEKEYYTSRDTNIIVKNGCLTITALKELYGGKSFTSARINTKGLFEHAYGRIEARIKTPYGPGIWPAFWMMGANNDSVVWPDCGEIDIMELRGQKSNIINGTLHGPGYSGVSAIEKSFAFVNDRFDSGFHVLAVEWGINYIDFYVDNTLYQEVTPKSVPGKWVFDHPFYIILNVAVGGNYVGGWPSEQTPFPQTMLVDYVRVYKEVSK